jgi:hypothetical protein
MHYMHGGHRRFHFVPVIKIILDKSATKAASMEMDLIHREEMLLLHISPTAHIDNYALSSHIHVYVVEVF